MVNPTDPQEFAVFLRKLDDEMPIHTHNFAKIKATQGFLPKEVMPFSAKVDNKFLNNYLATIDEINHRKPNNAFVNWFRKYQLFHYSKHGILNHDGFFNSRLGNIGFIKTKGATFFQLPFTGTVLGFGSIVDSKVFGATLETANTGSSASDYANDHLLINKLVPTGNIGEYYDRVAATVVTQAGNINMGFYDDVAGTPTNRLAQTGSISCPAAGYVWQSLTETAITTAQVWAAMNHDSATARFTRWAQTLGDLKFNQPQTSVALANPTPSLTNNASIFQMKIGHS